jgi:large subunit ribosomal protein L29
MKENADKARALDSAELHKQLRESSEQMFRLRFQMSMGQVDGLKKLRLLRRVKARMLTVLRERELHPETAPVPAAKPAAKKKAGKSKG